jgi:RTX calcium-binding nonapeptide repeat (4 copies)
MQNLTRLKDSRTVRPARLAALAVAVAAAVASVAAIVAGPGNAASAIKADKASYPTKGAKVKSGLTHGVLAIKGTGASDKIALRLKAGEPGILQVDVGDDDSANFSFKRNKIARISVDARAGADLVRIDEKNGVFTDDIQTTIDGGDGNDSLVGGSGAELLLGSAGDDLIDGNRGNDLAFMGTGDDTFVWDPGDGSDTVEGQGGADTMRFNGANAAEHIDLSANGNRLKFFRDVANITMDTHGVERVDFNALGGADVVTVNDLTGTDVNAVNVDLAGTLGGAMGDGQADRVVVNATNGNDTININGDAGGVKASGLAATDQILHSEAANDRLEINTLAGGDAVDSGGLAAGVIKLLVDGALVL